MLTVTVGVNMYCKRATGWDNKGNGVMASGKR